MVELFARQSDLDAIRQQLQSDPSTAFPFLRGVAQVVDRSYLGVAGPAADTWDTYSGRGGVLNPDRQIEWRLIMAAANNSGRTLWYLLRIRLNDIVIFTTQASLFDSESVQLAADWRIIATGTNVGQLIDMRFGASSAAISSAEEDLAQPWTITVEATWRDDIGGGAPADTVLTLPADAYFFRYHAIAVLT